jgi:hypothetical protein
MKRMVKELYMTCLKNETEVKYLPHLPRNPGEIFTQEEIDGIEDIMERIFCSYFTNREVVLNATLDFDKTTELGNLLFGIYYKKNGYDEQVKELLEAYPGFRALMDKCIFEALFTPYIKPEHEFVSVSFPDEDSGYYPQYIFLDDVMLHVNSVMHLIHDKPGLIRDIVRHVGNHAGEIYGSVLVSSAASSVHSSQAQGGDESDTGRGLSYDAFDEE